MDFFQSLAQGNHKEFRLEQLKINFTCQTNKDCKKDYVCRSNCPKGSKRIESSDGKEKCVKYGWVWVDGTQQWKPKGPVVDKLGCSCEKKHKLIEHDKNNDSIGFAGHKIDADDHELKKYNKSSSGKPHKKLHHNSEEFTSEENKYLNLMLDTPDTKALQEEIDLYVFVKQNIKEFRRPMKDVTKAKQLHLKELLTELMRLQKKALDKVNKILRTTMDDLLKKGIKQLPINPQTQKPFTFLEQAERLTWKKSLPFRRMKSYIDMMQSPTPNKLL
jgi:hypothetical protein